MAVYKPAGVPACELTWTTLTLDEYETIRLIDGEGLAQETVAERMGVSRPTVTRIVGSARAKIAHVLMHGQALVIEGGAVIRVSQRPRDGRGGGRGRNRRQRRGEAE